LLGRVLLADDLAAARRLAPLHPGCRLVTRAGELLEPDGTLTVGPPHSEAGLLSRKSELREVREQAAAADAEAARLDAEQADLRRRADSLDAPLADRAAEIATLSGEAGELRDRIVLQGEKRERLADQAELLAREAAITRGELDRAEAACRTAAEQAAAVDAEAAAVQARLAEADAELKRAEELRAERQAESTAAQVALGRAKQELAGLEARGRELAEDGKRRRFDLFNLAADERSARDRRTAAELGALRATQAAADAYREREARQRLAAEWAARRAAVRAERDRVQAELAADRDARQQRQDAAHARELTVRDLAARRTALADRLRDEYGVELSELAGGGRQPPVAAGAAEREAEQGADAPRPPEDAAAEIEDVRRRIAKLGSVNLEALEQLAAERARERQIRGEFDDLTAAQRQLLELIEQINTDSRRLFTETLDTVRGHFQELFRKLFGGGAADIVLENPADVLESGIDITARPPGKELRSISLLSGGEKTLTAVALLLAVFRSKPSPFCLLDEVDAALDEANTARLAGALREFLDRSQFILITHKRRSMAAADVLHGVTMQESGVSKPVAVRLDDWPDEQENKTAA
jgi:chromosome segregation protein